MYRLDLQPPADDLIPPSLSVLYETIGLYKNPLLIFPRRLISAGPDSDPAADRFSNQNGLTVVDSKKMGVIKTADETGTPQP